MHRLMMCIFNPVINMEFLFINHKDGNKGNNELTNLEWVTVSENTKHAYNIGLITPKIGEAVNGAKISEEDAHKICTLLSTGNYTHNEISKLLNISTSIIQSISNGSSWKHISSQYDFTKKKSIHRRCKYFTFDELLMICQYYEDHPYDKNQSERKYIYKMLKKLFNLEFELKLKDSGQYYIARGILKRKLFTNLSSNFIY